jgi:hypothetical protein
VAFYAYSQNNSFGVFQGPHEVYVEADSAEQADDRATNSGLVYFDPFYEVDCECCGTRWSYASEYDRLDDLPLDWRNPARFPWPGEQSAVIYADGRIEHGVIVTDD